MKSNTNLKWLAKFDQPSLVQAAEASLSRCWEGMWRLFLPHPSSSSGLGSVKVLALLKILLGLRMGLCAAAPVVTWAMGNEAFFTVLFCILLVILEYAYIYIFMYIYTYMLRYDRQCIRHAFINYPFLQSSCITEWMVSWPKVTLLPRGSKWHFKLHSDRLVISNVLWG